MVVSVFLSLSEEWIFCLFNADSSRSTMSGIDYCLIGQYEQAATNMFFQFVEVAASEVGTTDATLEEYISGEHAVICSAVINKASR